VVYIINSWQEGSELEGVLASLYKQTPYMTDDPERLKENLEDKTMKGLFIGKIRLSPTRKGLFLSYRLLLFSMPSLIAFWLNPRR
jgi:hypothetical protein